MPPYPTWDPVARRRIESEAARRGRDTVVDGCIALLQARADEVDDSLILALGGLPAHRILTGESRADALMWKRVWATRGLLWVWDDRATPAIGSALGDESWRVREMAVKVVRRHLVGEHLSAVAALQTDPVARVRVVATDTLERLVAARA
jgi:hypothetical protein